MPAIDMDPEQLSVQPEGTTPSPFEAQKQQQKQRDDQAVRGRRRCAAAVRWCAGCSAPARLCVCITA